MAYHQILSKNKQRVPLVEQDLHTLPKHTGSPPDFRGVYAAPPLVLCVVFC